MKNLIKWFKDFFHVHKMECTLEKHEYYSYGYDYYLFRCTECGATEYRSILRMNKDEI